MHISRVVPFPQTVADARHNWEMALTVRPCVLPRRRAPLMRARAAQVLRRTRQPPIPAAFLWCPEHLIQGHHHLLWGLLGHVQEAYRQEAGAATDRARALAGGRTVCAHAAARASAARWCSCLTRWPQLSREPPLLPYTTQQLRRLERSLLSWLHSLGALRDYGTSVRDQAPWLARYRVRRRC